jgi:hypothetical protein
MASLRCEWLLTSDGAVNAMRFSEATGKFTCHIRYISTHRGNQVVSLRLIVEADWVLKYYGEEVLDYIKEASKKDFDGFMPVLINCLVHMALLVQ